MVTRLFPASGFDINAGILNLLGQRRTCEQVIHAQPGASVVASAVREIPVSVDTLAGVDPSHRVHSAQGQYVRIGCPAFREEDCVTRPTARDYGVNLGRDDIVVTTQHRALVQQ